LLIEKEQNKKEWWMPEQHLTTDSDGFVEVSGFKSKYTAEFESGAMNFSID